MKPKITLLATLLFLVCLSSAYALETSLYPRFSGKTVKVFIMDVKDSIPEHELDIALVRSKLEMALKERKSITFRTASSAEEADLTVEIDLVSFSWTDHDPVDMIVGIGATAMDAAVVEDYASMQADVTVSDKRSVKPIWRERIFATVTKKPMSKTESVPLVTDNFVKTFIRDCFSKRRG